MSKRWLSGQEELERCSRYLGWISMSFTDDYTAEELLKLWRYCVANPDLPEMIDTWDADMIVAALKETP